VLHNGKAGGLLGIDLSSKAPKKDQPDFKKSDLPTNAQKQFDGGKKVTVKVADLKKMLCNYTFALVNENDVVTIKKVTTVQGCQNNVVPTGLPALKKIEFKNIPKSKQDLLTPPGGAGIKAKTQPEIVAAYNQLVADMDKCQKDKNCPTV